jgi:transposase
MDIHKNARLTWRGREALVNRVLLEGVTWNSAAAEFQVSVRTAAKWVRRYQAEGSLGLRDRSFRPQRFYRQTSAALVQQVELLRRQRWIGCRIARSTGLSPATVSRILQRQGLSRLRDVDPQPPKVRYEYEHPCPGDLLHLDIEKLGRFGCVGIASTETALRTSPGWAGNMCTWPSTITRASLFRRSPPTNKEFPPPLFSMLL